VSQRLAAVCKPGVCALRVFEWRRTEFCFQEQTAPESSADAKPRSLLMWDGALEATVQLREMSALRR
jgi:hypothetical protein